MPPPPLPGRIVVVHTPRRPALGATRDSIVHVHAVCPPAIARGVEGETAPAKRHVIVSIIAGAARSPAAQGNGSGTRTMSTASSADPHRASRSASPPTGSIIIHGGVGDHLVRCFGAGRRDEQNITHCRSFLASLLVSARASPSDAAARASPGSSEDFHAPASGASPAPGSTCAAAAAAAAARTCVWPCGSAMLKRLPCAPPPASSTLSLTPLSP